MDACHLNQMISILCHSTSSTPESRTSQSGQLYSLVQDIRNKGVSIYHDHYSALIQYISLKNCKSLNWIVLQVCYSKIWMRMSQSSRGPLKINERTAYIQTWFINCKFQVLILNSPWISLICRFIIINLLLLCFDRWDDCFICLHMSAPCSD